MKTETAKTAATAIEPNTFSRKIGNTTFLVSVAYSGKSRERIEDKIMQLVVSDCQPGVIRQCS